MWKKILSILLAVFLLLTFGACGANPSGDNDYEDDDSGKKSKEKGYKLVSVLNDPKFEHGVTVRQMGIPIYKNEPMEGPEWFDNRQKSYKYTFNYTGVGYEDIDLADRPPWALAQWASRYSFCDVNNTITEIDFDGQQSYSYSFRKDGDTAIYENTSKTVKINPKTGQFDLSLRASKCFKRSIESGQEWPHLLLEQTVANAATAKKNAKYCLKGSQSFKMKIDMQLNSVRENVRFTDNVHAAICMFYAYIAYIPAGGSGFTHKICLGLTLFDNRWENPATKPGSFYTAMSFKDGGKESAEGYWIYNVAPSDYISTPARQIGQWVNIDLDILPKISDALTSAKNEGYMPAAATMDNLYVSNMYIGFEITASHNLDMSFKNIDIQNKIYTTL